MQNDSPTLWLKKSTDLNDRSVASRSNIAWENRHPSFGNETNKIFIDIVFVLKEFSILFTGTHALCLDHDVGILETSLIRQRLNLCSVFWHEKGSRIECIEALPWSSVDC
jgi:hypothetical protein